MKLYQSKRSVRMVAVTVIVVLTASLIYMYSTKDDFKIETRIVTDGVIATVPDQGSALDSVSPEEGVPDGLGVVTNPDGSVYVGSFFNGTFHGKGKITYQGGASYEGEFREGFSHVSSICTYSSGKTEECTFIFGRRQ